MKFCPFDALIDPMSFYPLSSFWPFVVWPYVVSPYVVWPCVDESFKGTVSVILSEPLLVEWHVRFTTVPYKTFDWSRLLSFIYSIHFLLLNTLFYVNIHNLL